MRNKIAGKIILPIICLMVCSFQVTCVAQNEQRVGDIVWSTSNLNSLYFSNGDPIPLVTGREQWRECQRAGTPACCYYDFNAMNALQYGLLYNGPAMMDPRGLAPAGYRIPTADDWVNLISNLGQDREAGSHLWDQFVGFGSDNSSQLSFRPSGNVDCQGGFRNQNSYWWSSTLDPNDENQEEFLCLSLSNTWNKGAHLYGWDGFSELGWGCAVRVCRPVREEEKTLLKDRKISPKPLLSTSDMMKKCGATNKILNGKKEGRWLESFRVAGPPKLWEGQTQPDSLTNYRLITYRAGIYQGWCYNYNELQIRYDSAFYTNGESQQKKLYPNGSLQYEFKLINGKAEGVSRSYDEGGNIVYICEYSGGLKNGLEVSFSANGMKSWETYYKSGLKDSVEMYYDESGRLSIRAEYKKGQKHGLEIHYYAQGNMEYTYVENVKTEATGYYANGKIKWTQEYAHGIKSGIRKTYSEDGKQETSETYANGKLNGTKTYFRSTGGFSVEKTIEYVNGRENGPEKWYDDSGKVERVVSNVNGFNEGVCYWLYPSGKIESEVMFVHDKEEGILTRYNEDGTVSSTYEYHNGERNGKGVIYVESDYKEIEYKDDREVAGSARWFRHSTPSGTTQQDRSLSILSAILTGYSQGTQQGVGANSVNQSMQNGMNQIDAAAGRQAQQNQQNSANSVQVNQVSLPPMTIPPTNQNTQPQASNPTTTPTVSSTNTAPSSSATQTTSTTAPASDGPWIALQDGWSYRKLASGMYEFYDGIDQVEMIQAGNVSYEVQRHGGALASNSSTSTGNGANSSGSSSGSNTSTQDCFCGSNCVRVEYRKDSNDPNRLLVTYVNLTDHYVCAKVCWLKNDGKWYCGTSTILPYGKTTTDMYNFDPSLKYVIWVANGKWEDMECSFPADPK